ncbi:uncharacterized protein BDR25DRAFT_110097 [Lindgomyces ingoldianus]|uniref:Uncharacterized protein n=1 Tax=Lindgomyces ingoldianus TaxID=673940 RepID=A0ACB6R761_9PLEO|nr:uncharacterized protein BDR25DRAFT_110097 [Lindgomyces ingoldianus]KAF2474580.1 hypothetical protein BDR25DRAFT_110097 [Lindgomyces ingoldianus]
MASAVRGPPGGAWKTYPPNRTLYCSKLPSTKFLKGDIKRSLYMLFATYGVVLDIILIKVGKMRGQAHVVFRDIESSTQAMRALQGFNFYGTEIRIAFAKGKSDVIAKMDGTFKLPAKEPEVETTDLQKAVFGGGAVPAKAVPAQGPEDSTKGIKRGREDEEESDDEGEAMDVSDSD